MFLRIESLKDFRFTLNCIDSLLVFCLKSKRNNNSNCLGLQQNN